MDHLKINPVHQGVGSKNELTTPTIAAAERLNDCYAQWECNPRQLADLEMIAIGAYSPLETFMGYDDWISCIDSMHLVSGELWPIPITFQLPKGWLPKGKTKLRLVKSGNSIATMDIVERFEVDLEVEAQSVYQTTSEEHPGVKALYNGGSEAISGPIVFHEIPRQYTEHEYLTPLDARREFEARGWKTIIAFQTRNPSHRAHEYLHKVALELIDGLFLNPLVGLTKGDDVSAATRMKAYRVLLENYYPANRVVLGVYPAAMRYAGPKEAILHAISRKNYGCSHFIVGRDHAGVGDYYGTYAAQEIFDQFPQEEIGITIVRFEHSFFCKRCEQVVSKRTCPHESAHHLVLSGTKVREMLSSGQELPSQFSRPEVAKVLIDAYKD